MPDILFTCAGTTDPVRGGHDGGILHIMRYYRPEKVYLFLSKEMVDYEKKDHRFERTFRYVSENGTIRLNGTKNRQILRMWRIWMR